MKNIILLLSIIFSFSLIMGCKNLPAKDNTSIKLMSSDDKLVYEFTKTDEIDQLQKAISSKKVSYRKILAIYNHYISLESDTGKQEWLLNKAGYMADKNDKTTLYQVELPAFIKDKL